MNEKKYTMEKVLHEIIRDVPQARRLDAMYRQGMISMTEAFKLLATIVSVKEDSNE